MYRVYCSFLCDGCWLLFANVSSLCFAFDVLVVRRFFFVLVGFSLVFFLVVIRCLVFVSLIITMFVASFVCVV